MRLKLLNDFLFECDEDLFSYRLDGLIIKCEFVLTKIVTTLNNNIEK